MLLTKMNGIQFYQFVWQVINSNTFVICENNLLLIIDPIDSKELYKFLENQSYKRTLIILTHSHFDHISGLNKVRQIEPNCSVLASEECSLNIQDYKKNLSYYSNIICDFINYTTNNESETILFPFVCDSADKTFETELELEWAGHKLQLTEYRGHSKDSICCIMDGYYLFSGDTILPFPTVTQLPGGNRKRFWKEDIPKLKKLVSKIEMVFPGHGMPGNLEDMLKANTRPVRY